MERPALIPHPQKVTWGDGTADFGRFAPAFRIVAPELASPGFEMAYEALARTVNELTGWLAQEFPVVDIVDDPDLTSGGSPLAGAFGLFLADIGDPFGDEGYRLTILDGAKIEARNPAGLFYGVQTLRQLLSFRDGPLAAPRCVIEDWPAWAWRGVMLDQGRNYQSIDFLKKQIDIAAQYKLNVFHLHPTEYPGWRVEVKAFPQLRSEQCYTQDELRDLVDYAAARFVNILPEIEMPGHCTAFLDLMPHLKCTNDTMCMGNEELYSTLETILTEVADIFPSPILHIGTDECEGGPDCPKCQAKWAEVSAGPNPPASLMMYFIGRMNDIVKKLGRRTMMWNDQMDQGLPKDIIIHSWKMDVDAPAIARQGYQTVNSHAQYVYFDHGTTPDYVPRIYNWSPNNDEPMPQPNILGGQGEAWHDPPADEWQIVEDLGYYPRLLTLAERVWVGPEGRSVPFEQFHERLLEHKSRFFKDLPFPYPDQPAGNWHERYGEWTRPRGVWTPPEAE